MCRCRDLLCDYKPIKEKRGKICHCTASNFICLDVYPAEGEMGEWGNKTPRYRIGRDTGRWAPWGMQANSALYCNRFRRTGAEPGVCLVQPNQRYRGGGAWKLKQQCKYDEELQIVEWPLHWVYVCMYVCMWEENKEKCSKSHFIM
jgi:hypothetical protein